MQREILIVEDDAGIRQTIAECLELEGYPVRAASGGAEALAEIGRAGVPALILLDLVMSGMNGPELLERLRRDPATAAVPVVVMTAATPMLSAPIEGATLTLAKPFDLGELLAVTTRFLGPPPAEAAPG